MFKKIHGIFSCPCQTPEKFHPKTTYKLRTCAEVLRTMSSADLLFQNIKEKRVNPHQRPDLATIEFVIRMIYSRSDESLLTEGICFTSEWQTLEVGHCFLARGRLARATEFGIKLSGKKSKSIDPEKIQKVECMAPSKENAQVKVRFSEIFL